jgi:alkaline phosphatase/alkaline phosphatase D
MIAILAAVLCDPSLSTDIYNAQGEMAGEVTSSSVLLQSRLTAVPGPEPDAAGDIPGVAGVACFEWSLSDDFANARRTPWLRAEPEMDYIVRQRIEDLAPGTRYFYRLLFGRTEAAISHGPARQFRTLPSVTADEPLSFVMFSCQNYAFFMSGKNGRGAQVSADDRSLGYPAYESMLKLQPDFFIGAGDIVYYDHPAATAAKTLPEMRKKWHEQARLPRLVTFFGQTPGYWSKDDHDFRYNDADLRGDKIPAPQTGIRIFREQMPIYSAGDTESDGYRSHRIHRHVQLWFTEGRDYRSANNMQDGPEKSLWGLKQREWLQQTLKASDAEWKILITPTPMVGPDSASKKDNHTNHGGFRQEADSFFQWLKQNQINNVLVFCGDRHWQYHSIHSEGVEEFGCGALNDENAIRGSFPGERNSTDPEGMIKQPFHYSRVSGGFLHVKVDSSENGPRLLIAHVDDEGSVLNQVTKSSQSPKQNPR